MLGKRILVIVILCMPLVLAILLPAWLENSTTGMAELLLSGYEYFLVALGAYLILASVMRRILNRK
jgi:hypothetical protein